MDGILRLRMHNQMLNHHPLGDPGQLVERMIAVQAQDYFGALWAVGMRTAKGLLAGVEQAFDQGKILRTHVLRPTWHFVSPNDIHWLLQLTGPRVHVANAHMYRKVGLDAKLMVRATKAIEKGLGEGQELTRAEIEMLLDKAGIQASGLLLVYILMQAELEGLICSGARKGKQFTYRRLPATKAAFHRDEALGKFALRFFTVRGPASARDLGYWSGLTLAEARVGLEMAKSELQPIYDSDDELWFAEPESMPRAKGAVAYLLPNYDEYGMSYKDHGAGFEVSGSKLFDYSFSHPIAVGLRLAGSWRRVMRKDSILIETRAIKPFVKKERDLIEQAAKRYSRFLGMPVTVAH